jgi:transposase
MAKRKFILTEEQEKELVMAYSNCRDGQTKIRYLGVRMYGQGYAVREIQNLTKCGRTSLMEWVQAYEQNGVMGVLDKRLGGNSAKLQKMQVEDLSNRLHTYRPIQVIRTPFTENGQFWTVEDVHQAIQKWYGVDYQSRSSILRLLHMCGFSWHRAERVFKSRREVQVMEFEEQLEKN